MVLIFSCPGFAQRLGLDNNADSLTKTDYYLNLFSKTDTNAISLNKLEQFIVKLEQRKNAFRSDHDFLKYLFARTHRKVLKNYVEYCSFNNLLIDGRYNCLTGTALYAILLDHFNFNFKIIETNYHIFLITKTQHGDILFEATDPLNGFVDTNAKVQHCIETYVKNEIQTDDEDKRRFRYSFTMYNEVTLEQLPGLFYYNASINAYNHKDIIASVNYLDKASMYYHSKRIEAFSKIILLTVEQGKIDTDEKEICLKKINSLQHKVPVVANKTPSL